MRKLSWPDSPSEIHAIPPVDLLKGVHLTLSSHRQLNPIYIIGNYSPSYFTGDNTKTLATFAPSYIFVGRRPDTRPSVEVFRAIAQRICEVVSFSAGCKLPSCLTQLRNPDAKSRFEVSYIPCKACQEELSHLIHLASKE